MSEKEERGGLRRSLFSVGLVLLLVSGVAAEPESVFYEVELGSADWLRCGPAVADSYLFTNHNCSYSFVCDVGNLSLVYRGAQCGSENATAPSASQYSTLTSHPSSEGGSSLGGPIDKWGHSGVSCARSRGNGGRRLRLRVSVGVESFLGFGEGCRRRGSRGRGVRLGTERRLDSGKPNRRGAIGWHTKQS